MRLTQTVNKPIKILYIFLVLATLGIYTGCKPNLPTKPPVYLTLKASVEIEGKSYPVEFTWHEENYVAWNEGVGWHTEWKSSHHTFVRILNNKYAVVVWLPNVRDQDLKQFHPTLALLEKNKPQFLRSYPDLNTGEKRDGIFQLAELKIERSSSSPAHKPMTKEEESLKANIADRKYGYLYGMRFQKEQWSRSKDLQRLLSPLRDVALLGKQRVGSKESSEIWRAFSTFNAGIAMMEKMDRHLFGFEFHGDSWTPLPYSEVYSYRERLNEQSTRVWVSYHGHLFDQQQHELLFDGGSQNLVIIWRYNLESLE